MKKRVLWLLVAMMLAITACQPQASEPTTENSEAATTEGAAEGTTEAAATGEVIKIGGLAPLTGDVAVYGNTSMNAVKLAIEEVNANGGILGKQVEFILYDEKGDATEAVTAYNRLMDDGVDAVIGSVTSKPTLAVAEVAKGDGILMITPTGTQQNITEGKANVFRTCFIDPYQGTILAKFAKENLDAKTVAVISNTSDDYSQGVKNAFIEEAKALGLEVVADESYAATDTDFRSQLTKMVALKPDVICMPDYYKVVSLMAAQAREVGLESTFVGPDGWDGVLATLDASNMDAVENSYFTNHYSLEDTDPKIADFVKAYREKYNEDPSAFSALGYDTVYMIKQSMETAGSTEREAVVDAMKNIEFSGVTGSLRYDENNNPIKAVTIMKIVDGKYTFDSVIE
ncbi:MAG: ABC transporter substrate-binding protein [Tissierellia bacterium]|nr:ABC transporter substrate-binding protein [Tissierellia bacterium]